MNSPQNFEVVVFPKTTTSEVVVFVWEVVVFVEDLFKSKSSSKILTLLELLLLSFDNINLSIYVVIRPYHDMLEAPPYGVLAQPRTWQSRKKSEINQEVRVQFVQSLHSYHSLHPVTNNVQTNTRFYSTLIINFHR